ncbi:MAG: aminotransferase class V-fold PLP-dependent enzyme [Richelia sp. RM2_1_2]|nr:aminotransferase class V-fold PLP-dependent enzyme [Richelia sp. SM1_7_0]NJN10134.1 aminotransferase class V-fold PLP-dependent enzyme [Richelia sp. RM1_1_1]NJO27938.1 aminotransferase class V-fold PLP-dependent enzyme [Richelia sp. SL_2_1]NJO59904.1 aminotransferase class V-fold PLP-dependent enzyme [Richelia sp. RM2_1_2]
MSERPIYLDCHSTTPVDQRVVTAMLPYFTEHFGNPSSIGHIYGWEAEAAVRKARQIIAQTINATPEEIIFTSGATEANNLVIKGVAEAYFSKGQHIITVQTEHNAVIDPCNYLKTLGFEITFLPVQKDGIINLKDLKKAFRDDTILVSIMAANNEIGVLQPLTEIGAMCREHDIIFHSDSAQAIGKIPLDVQEMNIDLMSLTAHKVYGPKGIGALYVRRRNPRVSIASQQHGGGQERGIRSGTLYTPQIVGFGKAIEIALETQATENAHLTQLRQSLWEQLSQLEGIHLNGHPTRRLAGNLNVSFEGIDGSALLLGLQQVMAVSSGSACSSISTAPSHVLTALGHSEKLAHASVRFGIGRFNTFEEINRVAEHFISTVESLRKQTLMV